MKTYTGSVYVNDFNMFNRIYRVYIQAEAPYRQQRENIGLFFVKGSSGDMIPLTALGTTDYTTGPGSIKRFNMFNTSVIRGTTANGASSGQVMEILEQIAREKKNRQADRQVLYCHLYSCSYSSSLRHSMKAGQCLSRY